MGFCQAVLLTACAMSAAVAAPLTIADAVRQASERYPAVQVSSEQVAAATAQIHVARLAYLPRVDMIAQANRATRNNVFGMLFPQPVIAPISGPVLGTNNLTSVWGSAVGALVSWEPFDFGYRSATVAAADAGRKRAEAALARTRFDVSALAADAYLTLLAAQQTERAALASVERSRTLVNIVGALVKSELRPGADLSRSRAELALAETQRVQARQAIETARAALAQLLGIDASTIDVQPGPLFDNPAPASTEAAEHPAITEQQRALEQAEAQLRVAERTFYPHFNLQGTSYARGTGALTDGTTLGGLNGLGPNYQNWGVGFTVTLPLMDIAAGHARREVESAHERTERARLDQIRRDLDAERARANAALQAARDIAGNTPVQLEAARAAESQAAARYRSGLGNIIEVAEAERLLTEAEIDDSLARLAVWRAMLAVARANGDVDPFLKAASR